MLPLSLGQADVLERVDPGRPLVASVRIQPIKWIFMSVKAGEKVDGELTSGKGSCSVDMVVVENKDGPMPEGDHSFNSRARRVE